MVKKYPTNLVVSTTTAMLIIISPPLHAQTVPSGGDPPASSSATTNVVVKGKRSEVTSQIDKRVYDVKNDPQSRTGVAADVLSKLPSVTVTPGGKLALRGDVNVYVMVDGKYPVNGNAVIQTLSAADIDHIEVITNPSAQYAPDGTAGIINIVTVKRHPVGVSGSLNTRLDTLNNGLVATSLHFTDGPWSLDSKLNLNFGPQDLTQTRHTEFPDVVDQVAKAHFDSSNIIGTLEATYRFADNQSLTADVQDFRVWQLGNTEMSYTSGVTDFDDTQIKSYQKGRIDTDLTYDWKSDTTGESLEIDAYQSDYSNSTRTEYTDFYATPVVGNSQYLGVATRTVRSCTTS